MFQDCKAPVSAATLKLTSGLFNVPSNGDAASCSAALGRDCQVNSLSGSGDFGSFTDTAAVDAIGSADSVWKATSADEVTKLKTSAGVGKLTSSSVSSSAADTEAKVATVSSSSAAPGTSKVSSATLVASSTTAQASVVSSTTASAAPVAAKTSSAASQAVASRWGRCGGNGWTGATSCESGSTCTTINDCKYNSEPCLMT